MPRRLSPSRDEFRALRRESKREGRAKRVSVSLRPSARARLNRLKEMTGVDDQSMAVDLAYMRLAGHLEGEK